MKKELFKALANKIASQNSLEILTDAITESNIFSEEELDNIVSLLLDTYELPTIKSRSEISSYTDRVNVIFVSFSKVKKIVTYSYQVSERILVHEGQELSRWEASKKGLEELFDRDSISRVRPSKQIGTCPLEKWVERQFGDVVTLE